MFTVVDGRLSQKFNHFNDYIPQTIEATDTRLMGVVVLRISWISPELRKQKYYQIIHLDYSEYGIDEYLEYEIIDDEGNDEYNQQTLEEMEEKWRGLVHCSGGSTKEIPISAAVSLIDKACEVWRESELCKNGLDEDLTWRLETMDRIELMKSALLEHDILSPFYREQYSDEQLVRIVSPKRLANSETINYFLMRLIDRDFVAAATLSTMSVDELASLGEPVSELQTLIRNQIHHGKDGIYSCRFVTLGENYYYYASASITLVDSKSESGRKVGDFKLHFYNRLSEYEASNLIKRKEYLTSYDVSDKLLSEGINIDLIPSFAESIMSAQPNGWLFVQYNSSNRHVNTNDYHLEDDVYCSALLSIDGEFVIMSHRIKDIDSAEYSICLSPYINKFELTGRYAVEGMVFQQLCESSGMMLKDLLVVKSDKDE